MNRELSAALNKATVGDWEGYCALMRAADKLPKPESSELSLKARKAIVPALISMPVDTRDLRGKLIGAAIGLEWSGDASAIRLYRKAQAKVEEIERYLRTY